MTKKQTFFTTVLLIGVVFFIGVIIGNSWDASKTTEISAFLKQSELDAESFLIEQELFERFDITCDLGEKRISTLSDQLFQLGKLLDMPDAQTNLGQHNYKFLKQKYHLMQIRTYLLTYKLQLTCGKQANTILYYYKQNDPQSESQGKILDALVSEYNLNVFAIQYGYSTELAFLEEYYDIQQTPTLIVNFEHKIHGLATKEQLTPLFYDS